MDAFWHQKMAVALWVLTSSVVGMLLFRTALRLG